MTAQQNVENELIHSTGGETYSPELCEHRYELWKCTTHEIQGMSELSLHERRFVQLWPRFIQGSRVNTP